MSWFSSAVKGIGHAIGSVASNPIVTGAAGLFGGPALGALVGGAGRLLAPGGNLGTAVTGAATGGIAGLGPRLLGGGLGNTIKGTFGGSLGSLLHGGGPIMDANGIDVQGAPAGIPGGDLVWGDGGASSGGGGGLGGLLGGAGRLLGSRLGHASLGDLALGGLAAYQGINAAQAQKRAGDLQNRALDMAQARYDAAAPLRAAGMARLLGNTTPAQAYADPTNPFAQMPAVGGVVPRVTPRLLLRG